MINPAFIAITAQISGFDWIIPKYGNNKDVNDVEIIHTNTIRFTCSLEKN